MNSDERIRAAERLRESEVEFISALRLGEGVDDGLLDALKQSIISLGVAWESENCLPKSVVNDLVGLYSWIYSSSFHYDDESAKQIRKIAGEVEQLIFQHVVPDRAA